jgi:hypothetical protein
VQELYLDGQVNDSAATNHLCAPHRLVARPIFSTHPHRFTNITTVGFAIDTPSSRCTARRAPRIALIVIMLNQRYQAAA